MSGDLATAPRTIPAILATPTRTGHTLGALIAAWLGEACDSDATRDAYERDLKEYLTWCTRRRLDPMAVKLPEITMYGVELAATPSARTGKLLAPRSRARKLSAVSSWYSYLVRAGVLDANPAKDAKRPRYDRQHSPTSSVDQDQAKAMKDATQDTGRQRLSPSCVALTLTLLIDLGIRVSEACGANLADLGQRDGMRTIVVRMKGGKVRTRPIPAQVGPLLDAYLASRPTPATGHEDALLVTTAGQRVSRHQVFRLVQRMAKLAGVLVPKRITPHAMRHTFNTIARKRGAALEDRRDALGHSSAAITQLYDHVAQSLDGDPAHLVAAATAPRQQGMDL